MLIKQEPFAETLRAHRSPDTLYRLLPAAWQYATWEEQQKDFRRARSVWERALGINYRNVTFWLKASAWHQGNCSLGKGQRGREGRSERGA